MPLPLASLLALGHGDHAHLDALVSEGAVRQAFVDAGHHVAGFGFWAVRRRARRQDPLERLLRQPRDWTWLVLSPAPPGELEAGDAALLARVIQGLHGVQFVQWTATDDRLSFTSWSLRTAVVRGAPLLMPGPARPEGTLALPPGPLLPDLTRWTGVPDAQLGAALIESAYVERVAAADQGAFTNVDVLALAGDRPVVVEVKRRARTEEQSGHPLTMTVTQSGTLGHLRAAGCEVHVAVLVAPKGSTRHPADALARGTWRAGAAVIRPGWGEMHVDLLGAVPGPSLEALRRAQEDAVLGLAPPGPVSDRVRHPPHERPVRATAPKPTSPRPSTPKLKAARRLVSFTFEYDFLRVWAPAPVILGGRVYPTPAAAFLAARTLDQEVRAALAEPLGAAAAVRLAGLATVREDWRVLRDEVAWAVVRAAYRGDRGAKLVATLPMLLDDPEVWGAPMDGLQGVPGLQVLARWRGELAGHQARVSGRCCLQCSWARPGPWPGFAQCAHPDGVDGTLACVGPAACRGPQGRALVAVTTPAGLAFRSKQAAHRT